MLYKLEMGDIFIILRSYQIKYKYMLAVLSIITCRLTQSFFLNELSTVSMVWVAHSAHFIAEWLGQDSCLGRLKPP